MSLIELVILALGLAMDAFAVSICKGLSIRHLTLKNCLIAGIYFGLFQAGMPLIGYFLGSQFSNSITQIDHWLAFILLGGIGLNMIKESFDKDVESCDDSQDFKTMVLLAIATSIDALAVGITFAFLNVQIVPAVSHIGIITFVLSCVGVKIGNVFGQKYKSKAEFAGGIILILIGTKILLEHLHILPF